MPLRRAAAAVLLATALAGGAAACASGSSDTAAAPASTTPSTTATSPASPSPTPPSSSSAAPGTASAQALCEGVRQSRSNAQQVVTTASSKPILRPAVALVLLNLREKAAAGVDAPAPIGPAFSELVAAVDDLDAQAAAALPPGADATKTPVTVDPSRLAAALGQVDTVCGSVA